VVLNPATPVETVSEILPYADLVLLMSVNPGFGGQKFIESTPEKTRKLRELASAVGADPLIEIDGGINAETAPLVVGAGARMLVAGNAVFGAQDPAAALKAIRAAGERVLV
jgi:ribulose-phosphate 3-epimerase